jgi:hypothetical protein
MDKVIHFENPADDMNRAKTFYRVIISFVGALISSDSLESFCRFTGQYHDKPC